MTPEQLEIRHEQNRERHEQNREHHCRGHAALTIEQLELQHNPLNLTQDELNEFNDMLGRPCSKNPSIFELNAGVNAAHELQASRGHRTKFTARATPRKFYVKTTNDISQSNCKLADDKETIVATTIIKTGEEIQCYYDASDNNKSAGDKRKQSEDYDDNLRDNNDSSNDDDNSSDNNDNYDNNSSDNNDPSDLGKKSTGDKRQG
jgi:hypothetical protein